MTTASPSKRPKERAPLTAAGPAERGRALRKAVPGDRVAIASYLGRDAGFERAIVTFADAYAEQNRRDYQAPVQAVDVGRVVAQTGL